MPRRGISGTPPANNSKIAAIRSTTATVEPRPPLRDGARAGCGFAIFLVIAIASGLRDHCLQSMLLFLYAGPSSYVNTPVPEWPASSFAIDTIEPPVHRFAQQMPAPKRQRSVCLTSAQTLAVSG